MYFMGRLSLESGIFPAFQFDWNFSNYTRRAERLRHAVRPDVRVLGDGDDHRPVDRLPARVRDRLPRRPRWRPPLLFAVIAPFFTTYLIRTVAWETILADDGSS